MPFTEPPTFTSGNILTAGQLNILSGDIEYINSLTDYVNLPFSTYTYGIGGVQAMTDIFWVFRHRHKYLHYYLSIDESDLDANLHLDVAWMTVGDTPNWTTVKIISTDLVSPAQQIGYADLTLDYASVPINIPLNSFMQARWDTQCNGRATNWYFIESSFTAI